MIEHSLASDAYEPNITTSSYKLDNAFIFNILQSKIKGGIALDIIDEFNESEDGRAAWICLNAWYEGDAVMNTLAMEACKALNELEVTNSVNKIMIPTFIARVKKNKGILDRAGQPMHEEALKLTILLGIKSSDMQAAKKAAQTQSSQWSLEEVITYLTMLFARQVIS